MVGAAFTCSTCNKPFRVISSHAGKMVRCPHCRATNSIPPSVFSKADPPQSETVSGSDARVGELFDLAEATRKTASSTSAPARLGAWAGGMSYTHSVLAKRTHWVALILFGIAVVVQVYILLVTEWDAITSLPMKLALPAIALLFVPASVIAITGLFLMLNAHCVEYLARIASR